MSTGGHCNSTFLVHFPCGLPVPPCLLPDTLTDSAGGGSALLPAPIPPVTLEEKQMLTKLLAAHGATIQELNTIRKTLSQLKGGGLAQAAYPAQVHHHFFSQPWVPHM